MTADWVETSARRMCKLELRCALVADAIGFFACATFSAKLWRLRKAEAGCRMNRPGVISLSRITLPIRINVSERS